MKIQCSIFISFIGLLLLNAISTTQGAIKVWKRDFDILNNQHWVGGNKQSECYGLDLPDYSGEGLLLDGTIAVEGLFLPRIGDIVLDENMDLVFVENSVDLLNCIKLKSEDFLPHIWMDTSNWLTVGDEQNVAIPDMERVPCKYDQVIFPKGEKSATCYLPNWSLVIHSLKFGDEYWTNDDIEYYANIRTAPVFRSPRRLDSSITLKEKDCEDPFGCTCGMEQENFDVCDYYNNNANDISLSRKCINPIEIIGFCEKICGASILLKPTAIPIKSIKNMLKAYNSDTYVSKVLNGSDQTAIQIAFAEKSFDGTSLDEAKHLYNLLQKDHYAELYLSGPYYEEGQQLRDALSIIFGSMCGVGIIFILIFLTNSSNSRVRNIRDRFHINARPLASYTANVFAKYDNSDRVGLFSGGTSNNSEAGSTMNLERSFENPMFEKASSQSASTSTEEICLNKDDDVEE